MRDCELCDGDGSYIHPYFGVRVECINDCMQKGMAPEPRLSDVLFDQLVETVKLLSPIYWTALGFFSGLVVAGHS